MTQFDEAGAQVLGLSVDSMFALKTWACAMGGMKHPLLADFWPHGRVAQSLGIFNDEGGFAKRALFLIDPDGVIRHSELHPTSLPDVVACLKKLASLKG